MELTIDFLHKKFDTFNKLFFNSELPEITIKISRTKAFGTFNYQINRITKKITPVKISISKLYNRTQLEIETTLIHEMIHYYLAFKQIHEKDAHGIIWQRKAKEISDKSKYNITKHSPVAKINTKLNKIYYFVTFNYNGKNYISRVAKTYAEYLKLHGHSKCTITGIYSTKDTIMEQFSAKTNRLQLISIEKLKMIAKYIEAA